MDPISFSLANKQARRIKKFINNPDSSSGVITTPSVIETGESITIPLGRVATLPNVEVKGELNIEGEVFIPSGGSYTTVEVKSDKVSTKDGTFSTNTTDIVSKVRDTDVTGVYNMKNGMKVSDQYVTPYSGFKNYIINGNFDIWQRGTNQTITGYGSDDRWDNGSAGSTKTHTMMTCGDTERPFFNASCYSRTITTSVVGSSNRVLKTQAIEDVTRLAGKTVTISFWARSDSNRNMSLELLQYFGTGGSPSATVAGIGINKLSLTTTWSKKIVTITLPSIVGKVLGTDGINTTKTYLQFWFDAGRGWDGRTNTLGQQSGTFDIAQVQLEEGSFATPFEMRSYTIESLLCYRYYIGWREIDTYFPRPDFAPAPNSCQFPVPMRATPTVRFKSYQTSTIGYLYQHDGANSPRDQAVTAGFNVYGISMLYMTNAVVNAHYIGYYDANAEL